MSQILNFGLPAPIDVQVVGSNFAANHAYANALLSKIARVPGVADARIQQALNNPTFKVEVDRMRAAAGRVDGGRRREEPAGEPVRKLQGRSDVLDQPEERRRLSDRRPDPAILAELGLFAGKHPGLQGGQLADRRRPRDPEDAAPAPPSSPTTRSSRSSTSSRPTTSATSAPFPPTSSAFSTRPRRTFRTARAWSCAGRPRR